MTEDKVLEVPVWNFNQGQQAALDALVPFMLERYPKQQLALLEGPAGTGKTFITNRIIEAARREFPGLNIGMTAPTHKAVRQLKKHSELKDQLEFGTIHRFLSLKEKQVENPKNKKEYIIVYEPEWNLDDGRLVDSLDVLIIDESSMLGNVLYGHIEDAYRSNRNLKVLFIGDGIQIPPVREKHLTTADVTTLAIPFIPEQRASRNIMHIKLDEIVRQGAGNPIIEYATAIRQQYTQSNIVHDFIKSNDPDKGIEVVPRSMDAVKTLLARYFDSDEFRADPDYIKVVAWRNDTVKYFNGLIRQLLYKTEKLPFIIIGDKLVMDKPLLKGDKVVLPNNEELEVTDTSVENVLVKYKVIDRGNSFNQVKGDTTGELGEQLFNQEFKAYRTTAVNAEKKQFVFDILHEDSENEFNKLKQDIANKAKKAEGFDRKTMWKQFYDLEKKFAQVKHNYCLTCHKAQGSTYDYCISMEWDINENKYGVNSIEERNRIKYVAATRSRYKLFIVR